MDLTVGQLTDLLSELPPETKVEDMFAYKENTYKDGTFIGIEVRLVKNKDGIKVFYPIDLNEDAVISLLCNVSKQGH